GCPSAAKLGSMLAAKQVSMVPSAAPMDARHLGASRSDCVPVAVGFSPRNDRKPDFRRVATAEAWNIWQASLRDAARPPTLIRGLKPTATGAHRSAMLPPCLALGCLPSLLTRTNRALHMG